MIELAAGRAVVEIDPVDGGRVVQIRVGGFDLLRGEPTDDPMGYGSFPMVPWAGRIRHGRFRFDDRELQLPLGLPPHAIHGTAYLSPWQLEDAARDHCAMRCRLEWPLGGMAHQHLVLTKDALTCVLTATATAGPMPATIGWHPWFRKPVRADLRFARMYERDATHIPTGNLVDPPPGPWDDCFVEPLVAPTLHYPGLTVTVTSDCSHWVVYDEPIDATCIEPQSGPPDAVNLGVATRLDPGDLLQRTMTIHWERSDTGR